MILFDNCIIVFGTLLYYVSTLLYYVSTSLYYAMNLLWWHDFIMCGIKSSAADLLDTPIQAPRQEG